ncbi:MAG: hypothetical protein FDZ70_01420 [Actinobacteria bacterium]|nr:MAG: hypothetical protein FDZ70_01420 [Actinomycetota bacterium]
MYQSDYILRLIEQVGTAFRRQLAAIREHRPEDALEASDEAVAAALGAPAVLAYQLTVEGLVGMLRPGGTLDVERVVLLAEVLEARSKALDAAGRRDEAGDMLRRAGALRIAATVEAGEERVAEVRAAVLAAAERVPDDAVVTPPDAPPDALASEGDGL